MSSNAVEAKPHHVPTIQLRGTSLNRPLTLSPAMRDIAQRAAASQPRLIPISHRRWTHFDTERN